MRLSLVFLLLVLAVFLAYVFDEYATRENVLALSRGLYERKDVGMLVLVAAVFASTVFLVPGFVLLCCSAGYLYGLLVGASLVSAGSISGAVCSFALAKHSGLRERIEERLRKKSGKVFIYEAQLKSLGPLSVFLIRLCPFLPNRILNYVFGLVEMPFSHFVPGTWLGTIPIIAIYTYLGSILDPSSPLSRIRGSLLVKGFYVGTGVLALVSLLYVVYRNRSQRGLRNAGLHPLPGES